MEATEAIASMPLVTALKIIILTTFIKHLFPRDPKRSENDQENCNNGNDIRNQVGRNHCQAHQPAALRQESSYKHQALYDVNLQVKPGKELQAKQMWFYIVTL